MCGLEFFCCVGTRRVAKIRHTTVPFFSMTPYFAKRLAVPAVLLLSQCVEFEPPYDEQDFRSMPPPPSWRDESPAYRPLPPRHREESGWNTQRAAPSRRPASPTSRSYVPMDGSVTESSTGNRTYRDRSSGSILGSDWTSPAGNTTYRDSSGRITGSSAESPSGTRTYRDDNGSITQTSSSSKGSSGDETTTFRRNGSIIGSKYVSPAGNVTWRDGSGSIISGPAQMKP